MLKALVVQVLWPHSLNECLVCKLELRGTFSFVFLICHAPIAVWNQLATLTWGDNRLTNARDSMLV